MDTTIDRVRTMLRGIAVLLTLIAIGLTSACAASAEPKPSPEPAGPSPFLDMTNYAAVNPDDYRWQTDNPGRPNPLTNSGFVSPDGIACSFGEEPLAACIGNNLPAMTPARCDQPNGRGLVNEMSTDIGL